MLQNKVVLAFILVSIILAVDFMFLAMLRRITPNMKRLTRIFLLSAVAGTTLFAIATVVMYYQADMLGIEEGISQWNMTALLVIYGTKAIPVATTIVQDTTLLVVNGIAALRRKRTSTGDTYTKMTRAAFLEKAALATAAVPFAASIFGISYGAYDYRVLRRTIRLPNLPKAFDGIRIGQISDIHCNPAYYKSRIRGGIELFIQEKPDLIFFTGDLVNYRTSELYDFADLLRLLRAPMGVFSVTGNHDYGDYISWPTAAAKQKNFEDFIQAHRELGFDLLMNEHRFLQTGGEQIAILGVENWGKGRFPKLGRLDLAYQGAEEAPVKLLLSHDPSHWDAIVRPGFPDIDVMFAGHTHGFQMGIEIGDFRWSPAKYSYVQWADLYREGNQYLYVNRGFGCLGFLGRIGMPPELTIIELKRA
ncbi:MAG: metallophosphoesterase [Cyclobacteriaceae bacterium]|nr:metallophosphoesterase [Cyclobacteriaceae bacterium]